jgi:3-oxoacyl-[acyl-carrier-protein] synthase II
MSADAHHMTAPSPEGRGAFDCMQQALQEAEVTADQVGHVNCHATSTPLGDQIELSAVRRLFADHFADVWLTSNKSAIGHLLGAAGSVETIFTVLSVLNGLVPPTLNLADPLDVEMRFAKERPCKWSRIEGRRRIALTNSFGFGGTNASLAIAEYLD